MASCSGLEAEAYSSHRRSNRYLAAAWPYVDEVLDEPVSTESGAAEPYWRIGVHEVVDAEESPAGSGWN